MRIALYPVLALLLLATGCTAVRQPGGQARPVTILRVENQAWMDMTIYVVAGSSARRRLGLVSASAGANLRIPDAVVGPGRPLRFVADPLGNQLTASSFEMYVRPGQRVTITIPPGVGRR